MPHRRLKRQITDQAGNVGDYLREETTGGQWLLAATGLALVWANLAESSYREVWGTTLAIGPGWLHRRGTRPPGWRGRLADRAPS